MLFIIVYHHTWTHFPIFLSWFSKTFIWELHLVSSFFRSYLPLAWTLPAILCSDERICFSNFIYNHSNEYAYIPQFYLKEILKWLLNKNLLSSKNDFDCLSSKHVIEKNCCFCCNQLLEKLWVWFCRHISRYFIKKQYMMILFVRWFFFFS